LLIESQVNSKLTAQVMIHVSGIVLTFYHLMTAQEQVKGLRDVTTYLLHSVSHSSIFMLSDALRNLHFSKVFHAGSIALKAIQYTLIYTHQVL